MKNPMEGEKGRKRGREVFQDIITSYNANRRMKMIANLNKEFLEY